jgi:hypothetical protein
MVKGFVGLLIDSGDNLEKEDIKIFSKYYKNICRKTAKDHTKFTVL